MGAIKKVVLCSVMLRENKSVDYISGNKCRLRYGMSQIILFSPADNNCGLQQINKVQMKLVSLKWKKRQGFPDQGDRSSEDSSEVFFN